MHTNKRDIKMVREIIDSVVRGCDMAIYILS